ncbi:MAG: hypothetical protein V3U09_01295 [Thermoplasmata archaeon]
MRRTTVPLVLGITLAFGLMAFSGVALAQNDDEFQILVNRGKSERLGGGDWITVRVGDTLFGVVYGSGDNLGPITMFGEYKRYLGGADIHDESGNFLRTVPIPVSSVFSQNLLRIVEFEDMDNDGLFDLRDTNLDPVLGDKPMKLLTLSQSWELSDYNFLKHADSVSVDFTLGVSHVPYTWVRSGDLGIRINGSESLERVEEVAITFHIDVSFKDAEINDVPWFRVTVTGFPERRVVDAELVGYRDFEGTSIDMNFKYDHLIRGWDFAGPENRLAMDTRLVIGNLVDAPVAKLIHHEMRLKAVEENGTSGSTEIRERDEPPEAPILIERNRMQFYDDWYKMGRLTWVSTVEVDGETKDMAFEVYGKGPAKWFRGIKAFNGFFVAGAFVYPQGQTIFHDPLFSDSVYVISFPELTNVLPAGVMIAQLVIGGVGIAVAFTVSRRRKREMGGE